MSAPAASSHTTLEAAMLTSNPDLKQMTKLFELAPEKMEICLRVTSPTGRHELTHRLRPARLDDWREYERNLRSTVETSEQAPDALQFDSAAMEAAVTLYDSLFVDAGGYCLSGEGGPVTCAQIPVNHKDMVIRAIGDVGPDRDANTAQNISEHGGDISLFSLDPDHVEVTLQAHASGDKYTELVHVFTPPSAADRISYSRIVSQALYVRGSQNLKTLLPARLPALVRLYDHLILEVRGYCIQGREVTDRSDILRHMEALHKRAAIQDLFEA